MTTQASMGQNRVVITAHRGGSEFADENTLRAFQSAIDHNLEWIEFDVQQTKDSQLVVFHDDSLKRRYGIDKEVYELTYSEIETISKGNISTYKKILQFCKGKIKMNIEVKENDHTLGRPIMERVAVLINQYEIAHEVKIISRYVNSIHTAKVIAPEVRTVWLYDVPKSSIPYCDEMINVISVARNMVTKEIVKQAHDNGKTIDVWTVDDLKEAEQLINLGVDGIITNKPVWLEKQLF